MIISSSHAHVFLPYLLPSSYPCLSDSLSDSLSSLRSAESNIGATTCIKNLPKKRQDDGPMRCQFTKIISLCPCLRSPIAAFLQPSLLHKSRFRLRQRITRSVCDALSKPDFRFSAPPWLDACKTPQHPLHAMATSTIGSPTPLPPHTVH